jgi:ATP-dependent Zn protease
MRARQEPRGRKSPSALECTAYHEAGHAVAAIILGRAIRKVTIIPDHDRNTLGSCQGHGNGRLPALDTDASSARHRTYIKSQIMMLWAGAIAEGRRAGRHNWHGAGVDRSHILNLACFACMGDEECKRYIQWLFERTKNLLFSQRWHWDAIKRIARKLLKHGTITGKEAKGLYQAALAEDYRRETGRELPDLSAPAAKRAQRAHG